MLALLALHEQNTNQLSEVLSPSERLSSLFAKMEDGSLIEVEPTRIGALGIGTFLILAGGIIYLMLCLAGTAMKRSSQLYLVITVLYGSLILFLTNAKRQSRYTIPDNVVSDVDNLWLTRILVGTALVVGCFVGVVAWIRFDFLSVVVAKEIHTERDRRNGRPRFLF